MGLAETLKQAALDAVGNTSPTAFLFGEVVSINPLKIKVDQKLELDIDFFVIPQSMTRYEVDLTQSKIVIREGILLNDKLLLCREQGGQRYIVIDKV